MTTRWVVYSYSGSMLTFKLVSKPLDTDSTDTVVYVASPYGEMHSVTDNSPGLETERPGAMKASKQKPSVIGVERTP